MKKLISALMLAALASGSVMATEGTTLAATRGAAKARHSIVSSKKRSPRVHAKKRISRKRRTSAHKGVKKSVGKVVRVPKARGRKAKPADPASTTGTPMPISQ